MLYLKWRQTGTTPYILAELTDIHCYVVYNNSLALLLAHDPLAYSTL